MATVIMMDLDRREREGRVPPSRIIFDEVPNGKTFNYVLDMFQTILSPEYEIRVRTSNSMFAVYLTSVPTSVFVAVCDTLSLLDKLFVFDWQPPRTRPTIRSTILRI